MFSYLHEGFLGGRDDDMMFGSLHDLHSANFPHLMGVKLAVSLYVFGAVAGLLHSCSVACRL